jgi:Leucine-rich repeat (LRR) protein
LDDFFKVYERKNLIIYLLGDYDEDCSYQKNFHNYLEDAFIRNLGFFPLVKFIDTPIPQLSKTVKSILSDLKKIKTCEGESIGAGNKPFFFDTYYWWRELCKIVKQSPIVTPSSYKNGFISVSFTDGKPYPSSLLLGINIKQLSEILSLLNENPFIAELDFSYAEIENWPHESFSNLCKNTLKLDLRSNNFKSYEFIRSYTSLKKLNLGACSIRKMPSEIFFLKNLTILFMYKNQIDSFSPKITNLKKLKRLTLYRNLIREVPDYIYKCSELETLNLGANPIEKITKKIHNMPSLKSLGLRNCKLKKLPVSSHLIKSIQVDLSKNYELEEASSL